MKKLWSRLRSMAGSNRGLKILSLLLAAICWYLIREMTSFEIVIRNVPIKVLVAPGLAVRELSANATEVTLRGAQSDVLQIRSEAVAVVANLSRIRAPGVYEIRLWPHMVRVPGSVRATALDPDRVTVSLEPEKEAELPVKLQLDGGPPLGYVVDSVQIEPALVRVRGPATLIGALEAIETEPVELPATAGTIYQEARLRVPDIGGGIRLEPSRVTVEVRLTQAVGHRIIPDVPVRVVLAPEVASTVRIKPPRVQIEVRGDSRILEKLEPGKVLALVDCSGLAAGGEYDLPVRGVVPPGLTVQRVEPPEVTVRLLAR